VRARVHTRARTAGFAAVLALVAAGPATASTSVSPAISVANELQIYSLAVSTEKANAATTKIVVTFPDDFAVTSFLPSPGWRRVERQTMSRSNGLVTRVTWSGGRVPAGEAALFQFVAEAVKPGTYRFLVRQTYSNGSDVDWSGAESSVNPAPTIRVAASIGGGGSSTEAIVAIVLGGAAVFVGGVALTNRSRGRLS
jgi:uncharacterized protein YcnI